MVTTVPPDQPSAHTRRPIFVSASVHRITTTKESNSENLRNTSKYIVPWTCNVKINKDGINTY
jgi:hypothetical protein